VVRTLDSARIQGCAVVAIGGEAGVGKTALAEAAADQAARRGWRVARGWCLPERLGPLMPVREALASLGLAHTIDPEAARVEAVYIIDPSGLLIAKTEREGVGGDADILAAMVTAVREFSRDAMRASLGERGAKHTSSIAFEDQRIVVARSEPGARELMAAALVVGQETPALFASLSRLASRIGEEHQAWLASWKGETAAPEQLVSRLREFVDGTTQPGTQGRDDPKLAYLRALDSSVAALKLEAGRGPVLVFIDDAHWADEPTLGWLHQVARSSADALIALMLTFRPEETPDSPEGLEGTLRLIARESRLERVDLGPLAAASVPILIETSIGGPVKDQEYLERLYRATGGNPLFVIETTKLSVEEKALTRDGVGWRLARDLRSLTIPARVRDVVARRVSSLSKEEREVAETAAVVGEEFTLPLLAEIAGGDRREVAKALDSLERAHRILHSTPRGYRFHHSILRETLYDGLGAGLRREIHAAAAEAILRSGSRVDRREELLAWHFAQAGDAERGVPAILEAAAAMERRYDNAAVARLCDWGLRLMRTAEPPFAARDSAGVGSAGGRAAELPLLILKGEAEERAGRLAEARATFEETCAVALDSGDEEALARASVRLCVTMLNMGDPARVLEVWEQTGPHLSKGRRVEAARLRRHAADALRMSGRLDEAAREAAAAREEMERAAAGEGELAGAYHTLANVSSARGDPAEAVRLYRKAMDLVRSAPDLEESAPLLYSLGAAAYNCGVSHLMLGDLAEAGDLIGEARRIWTKLGDEHGLATSLAVLGDIAMAEGRLDEAEELCEESAALSARLGDVESVAIARMHQAEVRLEQERHAAALECLEEAARILEAHGLKTVLPSVHAMQAKALAELGDVREARKRLDRAGPLFAEAESATARVAVLVARAVVEAREGDREGSRKALGAALELCVAAGLKIHEPEIKMEFGRTLHALGEREEAEELLLQAAELFRRLGRGWWADRARALARG
jgi:tetratricopeptide (TPR) repeat protein